MHPWTKFAAVAVSAVLSFSAVAQSTPPAQAPRLGETIDVSIVNVDAIVTDKQGNRVRGLTRDDFEILENGKPQPITNFADYTTAPQSRAAEAQTAEPQRRAMIVFIEHFRGPDYIRESFFRGMRDFLHRSVRPGDAVKIVAYTNRVETRQDFTDDLGKLDRALDTIASESGPGIDPILVEDLIEFQTFGAQNSGGATWVDANGNEHASLGVTRLVPTNERSVQATLQFMRMRRKVAAITALLGSMAGADAKKVFVMSVRQFLPTNPYSDVRALTGLVPDYGWSTAHRSDALVEYVTKTANANGITVYPLYPIGLGMTGFGTDAVLDYQLAYGQLPFLDAVARDTGGIVSWGNNIAKELPRAAEDLDAYYSLGYRAANKNVDRARTIIVKAKNPEYRVRSRHEYVEKSDETRMRERVIAGLFDQPAASSMPITVDVGKPRSMSGGRYKVPVTVHIPTASLMTDGGRGQFSVFVGYTDVRGAIGPVKKETQKFTARTGMPEVFTYTFDVMGDRETDRVSVGVFDEVSKDYGLRRIDLGNRVATF